MELTDGFAISSVWRSNGVVLLVEESAGCQDSREAGLSSLSATTVNSDHRASSQIFHSLVVVVNSLTNSRFKCQISKLSNNINNLLRQM